MKDEKNYKKIRELIDKSGLIKGAYKELIISGIAEYLNNHGVTVQEGGYKMSVFVINNLLYNTDNMRYLGEVKKPIKIKLFPNQKRICNIWELYRSEKNRYLIVRDTLCGYEIGEVITEQEAKELLFNTNTRSYIKNFNDIEEA